MLTVDDALTRLLARIRPLDAERVELTRAAGRVLAEAVTARRALPAFDNSAMDGYAVRAADVGAAGVRLPVAFEVAAGDAGDRPLAPGTAARIFTGAPLPPGADAVIAQEDAVRDGDRVTFTEAPKPGQHVRPAGGDIERGAPLLAPGRVLTPGDLAALAAQGRAQLAAVRRPVVAITSTGDELIDIDAGDPARGQIVNGNSLALAAAVEATGAIARILPVIPDDPAATRAGLARAARADALITTGGVSVGDHDHVGDTLRALGGDAFGFWKVRIKPGKPFAFGHIGDCACFGLPGNPISALVTFEVLVRPALLRLAGHDRVCRRPRAAVLDHPLAAGSSRREYLRATARHVDGRLHVDCRRSQSSGALSSLAGADALVVVPVDAPARAAGDVVEALLLGPDDPLDRESPLGLTTPLA
ncbi:MAG: molybdopterin molybdotransferase MoeA [Myxococcales bacterium]|nr:molybdopterin molybdotransferase MoeA [Myxococcales bacterium]